MTQKVLNIGNFQVGNDLPMFLIAGPCQLESLDHSLMIGEKINKICDKLGINYIFKSSFDKANRSHAKSKRGIGIGPAIEIFEAVRAKLGCPILTDVHNENQCEVLSGVVDVLQIPAFLCRQTDLLKCAAQTGKIVNIKKGQFLAPWDAKNIVEKMEHFDNENIMLTERGTSFGYNTLVSDMRGLEIMRNFGYPVIFDGTHSVQQPGGRGNESGGERKFVEILTRSAIAATKIAGIFLEVHEDPINAPSDGHCMLELDNLESVLTKIKAIDDLMKNS